MSDTVLNEDSANQNQKVIVETNINMEIVETEQQDTENKNKIKSNEDVELKILDKPNDNSMYVTLEERLQTVEDITVKDKTYEKDHNVMVKVWNPQQSQNFSPQQGQDLAPQQTQGWGPPQGQGRGPPQSQGWGPPQGQGWGPPQGQGWGPPQGQGWGPPQGQGWGPPQGQGWGPPPQGWGPPPPQGPPPASNAGWRPHYTPMGPKLEYDPASRNSFVRLVMTIVFIMLLATAIFIAVVLIYEPLRYFFARVGWAILLPALGLMLVVDYAMICSPCTRRPPCNIIMLILAVIAMSVIAAKVSARYGTEVVLYAVIATTVVVFVCVLLAFSKFDFTRWLLYVVVIGVAFSVIAMIIMLSMLVTGHFIKPLTIVVLAIGTLIEVVMLVIQLQTILGGRSVELGEDDYALGAFMVYTSIVDIFIKMVQIIGLSES